MGRCCICYDRSLDTCLISRYFKMDIARQLRWAVIWKSVHGLSYYAFSGEFSVLSWTEYAIRVDKYYVQSISNPIFLLFQLLLLISFQVIFSMKINKC
jgi:hypothetical protein